MAVFIDIACHLCCSSVDTSLYCYYMFPLKGYKQDKAFIVAQSPMKNTVRDFWKMIYDRQCASIVMLCEIMEDGRVSHSVHLHTYCYNQSNICRKFVLHTGHKLVLLLTVI